MALQDPLLLLAEGNAVEWCLWNSIPTITLWMLLCPYEPHQLPLFPGFPGAVILVVVMWDARGRFPEVHSQPYELETHLYNLGP